MNLRLVAFRLLSLAALAVCTAMAVDYLLPSPAFCGFRAGCEQVVYSDFGSPLGIPLPFVGLLAFGSFFALTLIPESKFFSLLGPLAIVAGFAGLALVGVQIWILKRTCPFCLMVDVAAMLLAAVELGFPLSKMDIAETSHHSGRRRSAWIGMAIAVVVGPLLWAALRPAPEVPEQVKALWHPEKITVVEITDFACPYCRQTHPVLEEFLEKYRDRIHSVRIVVPLEHHKNSRAAAEAYLSADQQGKGDVMADALFAADDLSAQSSRELARGIGLALEQFDECRTGPATERKIEEASGWVTATDAGGLPQIWIQDVLLVGSQTVDSLQAALRRVEQVAQE